VGGEARFWVVLTWVAYKHDMQIGIKKNVTPDLVEGQQLDVRRWEGAKDLSLFHVERGPSTAESKGRALSDSANRGMMY
jgi:hypothetical protein